MHIPGGSDYRNERRAFVDTLHSLTPEEFERGATLCEGWAPRDVLAHLLGVDRSIQTYVKAGGNTRKANAVLVAEHASLSREELLDRAEKWAQAPALHARMLAPFLLGDVAIHHQDVLRGLGKSRDVPGPVGAAILREGLILGGFLKLRSHRIVPTDGGRAMGRGPTVTGTREVLGLWLSGRRGLETELLFG